ncbi:epoxide hydrolase 4-like [Condylostylus longicornis]|uniref:epoxide hydrolase 4-like n=1 Tax=Condylostylus longicornis TaxID=2530218 RepID=UPI00244E0D7D|nr:epoxide hydrolase 4-like [Condylostylus longicornis]
MSDRMFIKNQFIPAQNYSNVIEPLPKRQLILFYIESICIGVWILIKWLLFFIWNNITIASKNHFNRNQNNQQQQQQQQQYHQQNQKSLELLNNYYYYSTINNDYYPNKPPQILVDNKLGRHSYIKLKGVKFHYVECGNIENPLIILLHGFPDCWLGWYKQIIELSRFFHVISIDLKGFNDSDKPNWRNFYKPEKICEELKQFIFSLGYNTTTIIGHDLGALIGWYFAHTNPDNIERFICISTPHPNLIWDNLNTKCIMNRTWLKFIQLPYIPELDHSSRYSNFLEKCLSKILLDKSSTTTAASKILYSKKSTSNTNLINNLYLNNINNQLIFDGKNFDQIYTKDNLKDCYKYIFSRRNDWTGPLNYYRSFPFYRIKENCIIKCPVLLITGNEDDYYRLESIIKSTDYCNNSIVKIIEACGHWPHRQASIEFNKILLNFLVGKRAQEQQYIDEMNKMNTNNDGKNNIMTKGIMGRMFGAVTSTSVKIGSSVIDSVHQKTNTVLNNALY